MFFVGLLLVANSVDWPINTPQNFPLSASLQRDQNESATTDIQHCVQQVTYSSTGGTMREGSATLATGWRPRWVFWARWAKRRGRVRAFSFFRSEKWEQRSFLTSSSVSNCHPNPYSEVRTPCYYIVILASFKMGQRASLEISQQNRNSRSPRWGSFRASSSGGLEVGDNDRDLSLLLDHYRQELRALKVKGEKDANSRDNELEQLETVLYEKRLDLHRLGEEAKSYVTFWEYVKVIQKAAVETASTTASRPKSSSPSPDSSRKKKRHSTPSQTNTSPKKSTKNSKKSKRNTTTAIVPVSVVASFTVFSFFEAYLLKRM